MGVELDDIIKFVLYNKDGTVDYVFDDAKFDEILAPFVNEDISEKDQDKALFLSSSKDGEDALCLLVILCWYDWWNEGRVEYNFEVSYEV